METTGNHIHFLMSHAIAFLALGRIARWYVRPVLKGRDLRILSPLLSYGDLPAPLLALIAVVFIRVESRFAVPAVWPFYLVAFLDLPYANAWMSMS